MRQARTSRRRSTGSGRAGRSARSVRSSRAGRSAEAPAPRERRPQQRSLETRERLVEAALPVFAERGFAGASTREIARRAGVALAALPYHFTTKEALWQAAVGRVFGELAERFGRRLAGLEGVDSRTRLRLLLRDFVRFQAEHPELHRLMIHEAMARTPRLVWLVETHVRPLYDFLRATIGEAQREGFAAPGRTEHLHYMLIGAAASIYALAAEAELLTGVDPTEDALVAEHVATLERVFLGAAP